MAIQIVKVGESVNDGTGDPARTCFTKINQNFTDNANAASRQVGTTPGNVMGVGAFGVGDGALYNKVNQSLPLSSGIFALSNSVTGLSGTSVALMTSWASGGAGMYVPAIANDISTKNWYVLEFYNDSQQSYLVRTAKNTSVDPNGFIKNASPIVSLYADKIECNDEAKLQDVTFEKLGVGDYLVKGSLGFAQEGWYIEMPKDANGNVLVAVIYEQLANNDISVKTYAKKFDEETGDIVANIAKPRDIPATRWIDLRLQALPQTNPLSKDETVATNAE